MSSTYSDMTDAELQVAEHLKELKIWWSFQAPVFVFDEKDRPRVWTPDFYLPKLGMYIEVCGTEKFDYEYRERIYKKNGLHVVFVHVYKGIGKWKNYLLKRIMEIEEERHDEIMNMIRSLKF